MTQNQPRCKRRAIIGTFFDDVPASLYHTFFSKYSIFPF
jgi:hypothetical protein